jgi:hypothetical protein
MSAQAVALSVFAISSLTALISSFYLEAGWSKRRWFLSLFAVQCLVAGIVMFAEKYIIQELLLGSQYIVSFLYAGAFYSCFKIVTSMLKGLILSYVLLVSASFVFLSGDLLLKTILDMAGAAVVVIFLYAALRLSSLPLLFLVCNAVLFILQAFFYILQNAGQLIVGPPPELMLHLHSVLLLIFSFMIYSSASRSLMFSLFQKIAFHTKPGEFISRLSSSSLGNESEEQLYFDEENSTDQLFQNLAISAKVSVREYLTPEELAYYLGLELEEVEDFLQKFGIEKFQPTRSRSPWLVKLTDVKEALDREAKI